MTPHQALENLNKTRLAYQGTYQDHVTLDLAVKCLQGLIESTAEHAGAMTTEPVEHSETESSAPTT